MSCLHFYFKTETEWSRILECIQYQTLIKLRCGITNYQEINLGPTAAGNQYCKTFYG